LCTSQATWIYQAAGFFNSTTISMLLKQAVYWARIKGGDQWQKH
jgi:hypothetical protein